MVTHLPAHDVAQFVQVLGCEVPVRSVATSDVFVNAVQIDQVHVQCFLLQKQNSVSACLQFKKLKVCLCVMCPAYRIGLFF